MHALTDAGVFSPPAPGASRHWVEHFRVSSLSIGTYSLPVGGIDTQQPHTEDEVYVVTAGRARMVAASGSVEVGPGSVLFVPAHEEHRFVDVTENFAVVVVFAPPEGSAA